MDNEGNEHEDENDSNLEESGQETEVPCIPKAIYKVNY